MRVLAIGPDSLAMAKDLFEGKEGLTIDTTDIKPGNRQNNYDCIVIFNVINRVSYRDIIKTVNLWMDALRKGGEMVILFPSLEWAAEQILYGNPISPALNAHLFGLQRNPKETFLGAYTLMQLRGILQQARLQVTHVKTGVYEIAGHEAELHTIRGVK